MSIHTVLFALSLLGVGLAFVQVVALAVHLGRRPPLVRSNEGISILKPLCGVDDDLAANLEHFAHLDYPAYEVLLGVHRLSDPAVPIALAAIAKHPARFRLVLQEGAPGANPKVNQLLTLARAAAHDLVVISDSNVRARPDYLTEIASHMADPDVGLVTHPVIGVGEESLGSLFDAMHLSSSIATGMVAGKLLAGQDFVVGKSMALRRSDLDRLGGFAIVQDVLAEDFVLGRLVGARLGKRVVVAQSPVFNVSQHRSVTSFVQRYARWGVMQRKAVGTPTYAAQILLNPVAIALAALLAAPSAEAVQAVGLVVGAKAALDGISGALLRPGGFSLESLFVAHVKDLLIAVAWANGLVRSTVEWRGKRLHVFPGTRIATLPTPPTAAEHQVA